MLEIRAYNAAACDGLGCYAVWAYCLRRGTREQVTATQKAIDVSQGTIGRALAATRRRHAHRLTNATGTDVQNDPRNRVQNDFGDQYLQAK
jgi:hypothetical protein